MYEDIYIQRHCRQELGLNTDFKFISFLHEQTSTISGRIHLNGFTCNS